MPEMVRSIEKMDSMAEIEKMESMAEKWADKSSGGLMVIECPSYPLLWSIIFTTPGWLYVSTKKFEANSLAEAVSLASSWVDAYERKK